MNVLVKAAAFPALLLLIGGCRVSVDNKTEARLDHAGDQVGADLDKAGDAIGNTADRLGNAVEKGADAVDHGVKAHVTINGRRQDDAARNKH